MAQKIRVFMLAREFGLENDDLVAKIQDMGFEVRNYMSALDPEVAQRVRRAIQKECAENTVEEHIRPTVVRRRTREGTPGKPLRKRPPKVAAADEGAAEDFPEMVLPQRDEKKNVAAVSPPSTPLPIEPLPDPLTTPPANDEVPVEKMAPLADQPIPSESTIGASDEVALQAEVAEADAPLEAAAVAAPTDEAEVEEEEEKEEGKKKKPSRPKGVEVAAGPAVLRPSAEAPIIKRRIAPSSGRTAARGTQRSAPRSSGRGAPRPSGSKPVDAMVPDISMLSNPMVPPSEGQPGGRRGRTPQRRREIESRDIAPQGRFTGVGPGKFGSASPGRKRRMAPGKKGKKTEITTPKASKRVIRIEGQTSLQELAKRMGVKATELLMQLMGMGVGTININSTLDLDTAKIVASDFGYEVENVALDESDLLASTRADETEEEKKDRVLRPPVITMMGHVDHGKTSLLDSIRKSDIVAGEAGGITQHIGAYRVKTKTGTIAFIDTPGHEAFTAMRARGATVTDIVVLVTAADDGVMPQTIEAINHARAAKVPIIVAINKCDLPNADPNRTRRMLMEQNLVPEDLGGDIIIVEVSAKTGEGIDKLLEMIALQAEVMELSANPKRLASGVVLEAYLDRGRGPVANVLVQEGTLRVGEYLVAGSAFGKIRALTDEHGRKVKETGPSTPVEVLGLDSVPGAGDQFDVASDMKTAEKVGKTRASKSRATAVGTSKPSLDAIYEQMQAGEQVELKLIIKTDVQGTMEALRDSLEKLSTEKVKISVVHASVGGITESDVLLASTANAIIIGFNVRPAGKARRMSEEQGVEIRIFSIIYEVVDSVKQAMLGLLEPEVKEEVLGQVEVRDTFSIPKIGTIAGSYVSEGKVIRNARARLIRDSVAIWEGRLGSLRRFKDDVKEVASGFECGISLDGYNDVKIGDVIEVYTEKEIEATL
ncbi:MAG: translation initiation factor IF-2 [Myxococcota bacterium]|nr:translation initiation factor IF-2 [Myxococcota bacterium]